MRHQHTFRTDKSEYLVKGMPFVTSAIIHTILVSTFYLTHAASQLLKSTIVCRGNIPHGQTLIVLEASRQDHLHQQLI